MKKMNCDDSLFDEILLSFKNDETKTDVILEEKLKILNHHADCIEILLSEEPIDQLSEEEKYLISMLKSIREELAFLECCINMHSIFIVSCKIIE